MVNDYELVEFLDALASRNSTPSGGGATAVVGSMAVSLGEMVANLTVGKACYADVQGRIATIVVRAEQVRSRLIQLMDEDECALAPLLAAYALPHGTASEADERTLRMEEALRGACGPPIGVIEAIHEALSLFDELACIGSRIALSDVGVAASFARGASLNVLVNTSMMADRTYAERLNARTRELVSDGCERAERIFRDVEGEMTCPRS
mgnify:CR=1 FL=1